MRYACGSAGGRPLIAAPKLRLSKRWPADRSTGPSSGSATVPLARCQSGRRRDRRRSGWDGDTYRAEARDLGYCHRPAGSGPTTGAYRHHQSLCRHGKDAPRGRT
jgi:hypothetical protein